MRLDVEADVLARLQDPLEARQVVVVGVFERDVLWKATDLHGVRTSPDQFVRHHDGSGLAQRLAVFVVEELSDLLPQQPLLPDSAEVLFICD